MRKNIINFPLACLFIFFMQLPLFAQNLSDSHLELVKSLSEISGMKEIMRRLPIYLSLGVERSEAKPIPPEKMEQFKKIAAEAFDGEKLFQKFVQKIASKFSEEKLKNLLNWYKEPLAQWFTKLEMENSAPEKVEEVQKFIAELANKPLPQARLEIFKRLDKALKSSETNTNIMMKIQFGTMKAIEKMLPPEKQRSEQELAAIEKATREQLSKMIESQIIGTWAFIYKSEDDKSLEEYVKFYESELGKEWSSEVSKILEELLEEASKNLGESIGKIIHVDNPNSPQQIGSDTVTPSQSTQ